MSCRLRLTFTGLFQSSQHLGHVGSADAHLPRSQPASGLRRQPELCQQAVGVLIRMAVSSPALACFRTEEEEVQLGDQSGPFAGPIRKSRCRKPL